MRLNFHILWIDDVPDLVNKKEPYLKRVFADQGFNLLVSPALSVAEATALLGDSVFSDDIDLILVDYKLGGGPNGDVALREIRKLLKYREMIFYSSASARELRDLAHTQGVEGIYCAHRDDLEAVTEEIFTTIVRKVVDIDHSRGIVLGATSDLDAVIIDCIHAVFDDLDEAGKKVMLAYALKRINKHLDEMREHATELVNAGDIRAAIGKHMIFTSEDRLQVLRKQLKAVAKYKDAADDLLAYSEGPMRARNVLAHKRIVIDGFVRRLVSRDGKEITLDEMKELRRTLLSHREKIEGLADQLQPKSQ